MKKPTITNKKQWIKPEIELILVNNGSLESGPIFGPFTSPFGS
jgi:hypothetical protein